MFTGIIEEMGTVRSIEQRGAAVRLDLSAKIVVADASIGDSIAVNGVCLTAVDVDADGFRVDVIPESMARSALGSLGIGSRVNLERPMRLDGRLDGHLVQGHVDGVAEVIGIHDGEGHRLEVTLPPALSTYVVEKGSITIDGVSLTVATLTDEAFSVALIPHTLEVTTLGEREIGDPVNLEVDVIAKYVARNMSAYVTSGPTTS